ncbi:E3 ubiquitin-protein ligase TRIM45-like [Argopecten irradians]|uniref:E3 ubiquitin-protein ligase TRIM45-like n=1 Tax=Argopecten irradians TaxID=31199 RepID=UPI0037133DF6
MRDYELKLSYSMEEKDTAMDFIDGCVAELRLNDDVTRESEQVTSDKATKMTDGTNINFAKVDNCLETRGSACGTDAEARAATTVKSAIKLTLTPVIKSSEEKINSVEKPTRVSTSFTVVTNPTGVNGHIENGQHRTGSMVEDGIQAPCDVDTSCPVCGDRYIDPRVLPCLHSACLGCLYKLGISNGTGEQTLLHCPLCAEIVSTLTDIENLPPNTLMSTKTETVEMIKTENCRPPTVVCGFCCDEERAVAVVTCLDCASDLCQLCSDSHKRQRITRYHRLVCISTPEIMTNHADDTLHDVTTLKQLMQDTNHWKNKVKKRLDDIPTTTKELHENAQTVTKEIDIFIDSFVRAVELHRKSLLQQVNSILQGKDTKLQQQKDNLCRLLTSFENGYSIADDLAEYGTESEIAALETTVSQRLTKLIDSATKECIPVETTFTFCPEVKSEVFENFQMFGSVQGSQVCPAKCQVSTQDLSGAQVDIPCTVTLKTRDAEDEPFPDPAGLCAWVRCGVNGRRNLTVMMEGRECATYDMTFTPRHPGPHQLFVKINKQDISGCPCRFDVKPKWREHSGTWHCCSFCSSAGKMDVSCGCGSIVRGSRGCWHAHPGYPGGPHWTCCGKMLRQSECIYAIIKNNSNVLEATL